MRLIERVLIIEDDESLSGALAQAVRSWGAQPTVASRVAEAIARLHEQRQTQTPFDLVIVDVVLPDGSGVDLAREALSSPPAPRLLAVSGQASPEESFRLAQLGVHGYLQKPLTLVDLRKAVAALLRSPPELAATAAAQVGYLSIQETQQAVKRAMLEQALALSAGNRSEAARLLGVTRQAVQQMIRDLELERWRGKELP